jgi:hypothetical protein
MLLATTSSPVIITKKDTFCILSPLREACTAKEPFGGKGEYAPAGE